MAEQIHDSSGDAGHTYRITGKRRRLGPTGHLLSSAVVEVLIMSVDDNVAAVLRVHASILRQIPFFVAYLDRWSQHQPIKFTLPSNVDVSDCKAPFERIYTGSFPVVHNLHRALAMHNLVDMLLVTQFRQEVLEDVCSAVQTEDDLQILRNCTAETRGESLLAIIDEFSLVKRAVMKSLLSSIVKEYEQDEIAERASGETDPIDLKIDILRSCLRRRASRGFRLLDTMMVLEKLAEDALTIVSMADWVQVSPAVLPVWDLIQADISSKETWQKAHRLVSDLSRSLHVYSHVEGVAPLHADYTMLSALCERFVSLSVRLAQNQVITGSEAVLKAIPDHLLYQAVLPSLERITSSPELLEIILPALLIFSGERSKCLATPLGNAPLPVAQKLASRIILMSDRPDFLPCKAVYLAIRDRQLI
eukprot:gnl/TRDRNA2_/TRDRNA2_58678_c0_seq1.p1 gnl/TRDRNA2_/TRDRNA2_58678_c0~~gnl/TRDRNA2_/TRDRNA2_58678_c0_seq1.p1  ORF type:complete len:419 (+),score=32.73 gnl/TRDRNA2_/TRDRNA2_58678_c0_seq1:95-1351(+)